MKKKKLNPNRIPIRSADCDLEQIKANAIQDMVLQEWAVVLAALANFEGATAEGMRTIWRRVDMAETRISDFDDVRRELGKIQKLSGVTLPIYSIPTDVRTRGDYERYILRTRDNSLASAFALILEPIIREEMLPEEDLIIMIKRAAAINEEIAAGEITVRDIQEMLLDEYGVELASAGTATALKVIAR